MSLEFKAPGWSDGCSVGFTTEKGELVTVAVSDAGSGPALRVAVLGSLPATPGTREEIVEIHVPMASVRAALAAAGFSVGVCR